MVELIPGQRGSRATPARRQMCQKRLGPWSHF